ncbi:MAG TPA: GAP family protein [Actinocrinis sp.]|nr:GAP family protein [Actinocrinis sp.]
MLWEAVLTALVAGFAPWTLLVVAALLARQDAMRRALVFLASATAVTLLVGFLVVETLGNTNLENRHRHHSVSPAIDLALGLAILVSVPFLARRTPGKPLIKRRKPRKEHKKHSKGEREAGLLAAAALGAFAGSPSPLYLASLHSISKGSPDATISTFEVLLIGALVLFMAEVPIVLYALAPERTTEFLKAANAWLARNGRVIVLVGATVAGFYFAITGLVHLL